MKKYRAQLPAENHWAETIKCQAACPVYTDARGYIQAIAQRDYETAYLIARVSNPLASICGSICGAPCEAACRRGDIDSPLQIRALKRFVTGKLGTESSPDRIEKIAKWLWDRLRVTIPDDEKETNLSIVDLNTRRNYPKVGGQRIAIVGSGPAGLGAAHDLALMGFSPVVFERESVPAGMLYLGVPEYRLPRNIILAEVKLIEKLGVEIRLNTAVGEDIPFFKLVEEFDAVIIAVGAKKSRKLKIPGADAPQVLGGVEFLRDIALGNPVEIGSRIVVIGGGNVAFDVGRSVVRQTGQDVAVAAALVSDMVDVNLCCLESRDEMPADEVEIIEGCEEGIILHTGMGPKEIHVKNGKVTGVTFSHCVQVFDQNGRFDPKFDEERQTTIECDAVLLTIGQEVDLSFIDPARDGLEISKRGIITHDSETLQTGLPNVFVAGDLAHGPKLLIDAVASGKRAARSIYRHFTGNKIDPRLTDLHVLLEDFARAFGYEIRKRIKLPVLPVEKRKGRMIAQVELPLEENVALFEAGRCINCSINTIFDSEKCILCGGCVEICPCACLKIVDFEQVDGDQDIIDLKKTLYDTEDVSVILKDDTTCIRCGMCAVRCPASAITMEQYCLEEL
ncbi:MAG TPA: hypothetical protein ENI07_20935 [Desulfobacterales bacterium]|nr:hypothetical protein [Desulfobacterales bacterium]